MNDTIEIKEGDSTRPVAMTAVARSAGLYPIAREIWTRNPVLEKVSNCVSMHFGTAIPGRDGSLLKDCLRDAIAGFKKAETERRDPVPAYVEALINRATEVFDLAVIAEVAEGRIAWDPLQEPLDEFASRYTECTISVAKEARDLRDEIPGESALLLGVRLLPEYVARYLVRAIVSRSLHTAA